MNLVRSHTFPLALAFLSASGALLAAQDVQHDSHHPAATAAAPAPAPAPSIVAPAATAPMPGKSDTGMAGMDAQMKAMQEMHERMMAAKTPEQRKALMAAHMKMMQGGMRMMGEMSAGGMANMQCDMAQHHQMMEKRMEMMQSMMQMMMDRMPAEPLK